MASGTFVLKEPRAKDSTLVYLIFRFHNQRLKYSTGQKIPPKYWNPENQKARETEKFSGYAEFNSLLKKLEDAVYNEYRRLINDNIIPTPSKLRSALQGALMKDEIGKKNDLLGFAEELIRNSNKRPNTIKHYRLTVSKLKDFKTTFKRELVFENIDLAFYEEFMRYCLKKNYSTNTTGGYIKNIKVFMSEAMERKLTTNIEFRSRHTSV